MLFMNWLTKKGHCKTLQRAAHTSQAEVSHGAGHCGGQTSKYSTAQVTYGQVNQGIAEWLSQLSVSQCHHNHQDIEDDPRHRDHTHDNGEYGVASPGQNLGVEWVERRWVSMFDMVIHFAQLRLDD